MKLDQTDIKILSLLKNNARISYSAIGEAVGLSRVAIKNRIQALEQQQVIEGYYTKINLYNESSRTFFIDITTEPEYYEEIIRTYCPFHCVQNVYAINGECRIRIECTCQDNKEYESYLKFIKGHLKGIKYISFQDVQYVIKRNGDEQKL